MDSLCRIHRTSLRRLAIVAGLAALLAPAASAEAAKTKKKASKPVVTKVAPRDVAIGETLTIYGKRFLRGKARNTVAFKRKGSPAVFVKADVSTKRQLKVILPDRLAPFLVVVDGVPTTTTFRVRVLAKRFGKKFTPLAKSPRISPAKPPGSEAPPAGAADGDCDGDGVKNSADSDDDNDLLSDTLEKALKTDSCNRDTDGDGVEDGYEFQSARDLNDDGYQSPNTNLPYPGAKPYANPLFADSEKDFDGDGLTLLDEYRLWIGFGQHQTDAAGGAPIDSASSAQRIVLNYSDGKQASEDVDTVGYPKQQQFLASAAARGYSETQLLDFDSGVVPGFSATGHDYDGWWTIDPDDNLMAPDGSISDVERYYYDRNYDGKLSDDERDEDADGLPNWFEAHGPMQPGWWTNVYQKEKSFVIPYDGTDLAVADTDGDGVVDGADDNDHDDLPNVREIRRQLVAGELAAGAPNYRIAGTPPYVRFTMGGDPDAIAWNRPQEGTKDDPLTDAPRRGWVQPFNPCLPDPRSRTCEKYPSLGALYPPFDAETPVYNVFDGTIVMPR